MRIKERYVDQIADALYERHIALLAGGGVGLTHRDVRGLNQQGWTIEIPDTLGNMRRVEGVVLSDADLDRVWSALTFYSAIDREVR